MQPLSGGATAVLLHWSYLRRSALVGQALASRFPTEDAWQTVVDDPLFRDTLERFAALLDELREVALLEGPEGIDKLPFDGAHECLTALATLIGTSADDLLNVSVYA